MISCNGGIAVFGCVTRGAPVLLPPGHPHLIKLMGLRRLGPGPRAKDGPWSPMRIPRGPNGGWADLKPSVCKTKLSVKPAFLKRKLLGNPSFVENQASKEKDGAKGTGNRKQKQKAKGSDKDAGKLRQTENATDGTHLTTGRRPRLMPGTATLRTSIQTVCEALQRGPVYVGITELGYPWANRACADR